MHKFLRTMTAAAVAVAMAPAFAADATYNVDVVVVGAGAAGTAAGWAAAEKGLKTVLIGTNVPHDTDSAGKTQMTGRRAVGRAASAATHLLALRAKMPDVVAFVGYGK